MGTKSNPGAFDCYANADDDEPMFVLLARDPGAPEAVRHWAGNYDLRKQIENSVGQGPEPLNARQKRKLVEALACADAMEAWRKDRAEKG